MSIKASSKQVDILNQISNEEFYISDDYEKSIYRNNATKTTRECVYKQKTKKHTIMKTLKRPTI